MTNPPPTLSYLPPAQQERPRRFLRATGVVWAVLLVAVAIWYSFHGRPSVREQTTVEQAHPVVDRAIAAVLVAAGAGPVVSISGFEPVGACDLTAARSGARYRREVWLYVGRGAEPALVARLAAGLPASYHATSTAAVAGLPPRLSADAGDYVAITGLVVQAGLVQVVADTGCRPVGGLPAADPTTAAAGDQENLLSAVMTRLGTEVAGWSSHDLRCGTGTVRTIEADSPAGVQPGPLDQVLHGLGSPVLATGAAYATTDGLAVRTTGAGVAATLTSGTCARP